MGGLDELFEWIGHLSDSYTLTEAVGTASKDPEGFFSFFLSDAFLFVFLPLIIATTLYNFFLSHLRQKAIEHLLPEHQGRMSDFGFWGSWSVQDKMSDKGKKYVTQYQIFSFIPLGLFLAFFAAL